MRKAGIALVVIGIALLIFTGVSFKTEEQIIEIGEYELTQEKEHEIKWKPWYGAIVVLAGGALFLAGKKK
ncbi:MAG: hypothetical protein ACK4VN_15440 [Bacteroidales bacterium]